MKFLAAPLLALGCLSLAPDGTPRSIEPAGVEIVGPSVLLNAQATGKPIVYDLRNSGRAIPDALSPPEQPKDGAFLIGEVEAASHFIAKHHLNSAFVVPRRLVEFEHEKGVPQISPIEAKSQALPVESHQKLNSEEVEDQNIR